MAVNKAILINDLRRELRWAYKDQSVINKGGHYVRFQSDSEGQR